MSLAQLHGLKRDAVSLNYRTAYHETEFLVDRHGIEAGIDGELAGIASLDGLRLDHLPKLGAKALTLKLLCDKQMEQVTVVPECDDAG